MLFAPKVPEFYIKIARKIFFHEFRERGSCTPLPSVSHAYDDRPPSPSVTGKVLHNLVIVQLDLLVISDDEACDLLPLQLCYPSFVLLTCTADIRPIVRYLHELFIAH